MDEKCSRCGGPLDAGGMHDRLEDLKHCMALSAPDPRIVRECREDREERERLRAEVERLRQALAAAREALEFYADPLSWDLVDEIDPDDEDDFNTRFAIQNDDVEEKVYVCDTVSCTLEPGGGKRARAALAEIDRFGEVQDGR